MDAATAVLVTLVAYKLLLLGIGFWAQRRTADGADFFLGGHRLGPLVAAISASASSSSGWTLLGVSGFAFTSGISAVWLFPGCVGGFVLNWCVLAPRLHRASARHPDALTVTTLLAGPKDAPGSRAIRAVAAAILLFSLMAYVASQFQASGKTFAGAFAIDTSSAVLLGSVIVVVYTMAGGFWAVSVTDTVQGLVMAATAVALPIAALVAVGGPGPLASGIAAVDVPGYGDVLRAGAAAGPAGLGLLIGFLGIGLGYPGQPHVVNRFMALRDEAALRRARAYSIAWAICVYGGMIVAGLAGRVLLGPIDDGEQVFVGLATELFSPVVAGVMVAAVLSAIMSTADSQLLVAAAAVVHDLDRGGGTARSELLRSRLTIVGLSALAVVTALYASKTIFDTVLFAWSAMGAAFGPLLLVTLWRGTVRPPFAVAAMLCGFCGSVLCYSVPEWKGAVERTVPFAAAWAIAWSGVRTPGLPARDTSPPRA